MATTTSDSENSGTALESIPMYIIANSLWTFCSPLILLFGTFGNIMTIIITRTMASKDSTVIIYFRAMAMADLITLYSGLFPEWLSITFGVRLQDMNRVMCKLWVFLSTGPATISVWFLVLWTLQRALSVVWPHRVSLLCTQKRVIVIVVIITVSYGSLYSHYMFGFDLTESTNATTSRCSITSPDYIAFVSDVFSYLEFVIFSALPFVCLVGANGVLVYNLTASVREAGKKFTSGQSDQVLSRHKVKDSVTMTVIALSLTFIVLTCPSCVYFVLYYMEGELSLVDGYDYARVHLFSSVSFILMFTNSATNFYLYCLTGSKFRKEFLTIMGSCRVQTSR